MFDHVTIRASDREAAERFYATVLPAVGLGDHHADDDYAEWGDFSLAAATDEKPVTRGLHIAFFAASHGDVERFWRAGTQAGYRSDGEPGFRPQYSEDYYGAFLLDPDGNSAEAVHHGSERRPGAIDHLWIRVADVARAKRFYEAVAPFAGYRVNRDSRERVQFVGEGGGFSVVRDDRPSTEHVHVAFPAADDAAVDRFHRALTDAGYRDNGPPGERAVYHPGYYGAFVLDPDGNNVELVNHNRP